MYVRPKTRWFDEISKIAGKEKRKIDEARDNWVRPITFSNEWESICRCPQNLKG